MPLLIDTRSAPSTDQRRTVESPLLIVPRSSANVTTDGGATVGGSDVVVDVEDDVGIVVEVLVELEVTLVLTDEVADGPGPAGLAPHAVRIPSRG